MDSTAFDELENSFKRIEASLNKIRCKYELGNDKPCPLTELQSSCCECINESRESLLQRLGHWQKESLKGAELLFQGDCSLSAKSVASTKCFPVIYKEGTVALANVLFQKVAYTGDLDLYKKVKYSHLWRASVELIQLNEMYANRGDWHLIPFTKDKLLVHSKLINSLQLFVRKDQNFASLLKEVPFESRYFLTVHVNNKSQVLIGLTTGQEFVLKLYDEHLNLIKSSKFDNFKVGFRIVSLNEEEVVCWSYSKRYFLLDYQLNEKRDIDVNYEKVTGPLIHISAERVFFMNSENELEILDRMDGEFVSSIRIKSHAICCIKVDQASRVFIKTKKDMLSQRLFCYDKNGCLLLENELDQRLEPYDCFTILDNFTIGFIDFSQDNYVLF